MKSQPLQGRLPLIEQPMANQREVAFRKLVNIPSTTYATFALYSYPAKFIPHVVAYVLDHKARPGFKVFDPFAGYGTVGLVSRLYGCDYELWDLNPLLRIFHEAATLEPRTVDVNQVLTQMQEFRGEFRPAWPNLEYWFHEAFLPLLFKAWGFYHELDDEYLKALLAIPLMNTTRYFSYDDPARQKLSRSPTALRRVAALLETDWQARFFQMLGSEITKIIKGLEQYQRLLPRETQCNIRAGIDTLVTQLQDDVDILITSPPYLQSHEYIRKAKMDLFWLGYRNEDIRELEKKEIPYRDVNRQPVYSETYWQYRERVEEPYRQTYDRYFWAILGALTELQRSVRSYLCLFLGRATMRGNQVPLDQIFCEHFCALGWVHEETLIDTIVARRLFRYPINPATGLRDERTRTENLVILKRHL